MSTRELNQTTEQRQDGPSTMGCFEEGWWEEERARLIRERVVALTVNGSLIADVGCGRGAMLGDHALSGRTIVNIDSHVWAAWERRPNVFYVCASADALPFRDGVFSFVASFDVLEHLADDVTALQEQRRLLRPGGQVLTAVPADDRLWAPYDAVVGHHRRYGLDSFRCRAARAGLRVDRSTHFFSFLWLPAWLTRGRAARAEPGNGQGPVDRTVRRAVALVATFERRLIRRWSIPFGTSLWIESSARID